MDDRKRQENDKQFILLSSLLLLTCILLMCSFHIGAYFERRYIAQAIRNGQENKCKRINVPQLKLTIVPSSGNFIEWWDDKNNNRRSK